jgi:hypothetical protein
MKLHDAGIDEMQSELLYVLDDAAGKQWFRLVRRLANSAYHLHRQLLLWGMRVCYRATRRDR